MKKLYLLALSLFLSSAVFAQCTELYFSEYIEGSSNNKGVEIYNPTNMKMSLADYKILTVGNGGSFTNEFQLYDSIDAFGVFVIVTDEADSAGMRVIADTAVGFPSVVHFNGDDAVALLKGTDTIDVIGELYVDPGRNWAVDTGATSEYTLTRKDGIEKGQTDWTVGATEWDVHPQNTFNMLGRHFSDCERRVSVSNPVSMTNVYPNPSHGVIKVSNMFPISKVNVFDATGKMVKHIAVNGDLNTSIDLSEYAGMFMIHVTSTSGTSVNRVMVH